MAQRRCLQTLTRQAIAALSSSNTTTSLHNTLKCSLPSSSSFSTETLSSSLISNNATCRHSLWFHHNRRYLSSDSRGGDETEDDDDEEDDDNEDDDEEDEDSDYDDVAVGSDSKREHTPQEKEEEAAEIGYKVIGPLGENERVIKAFEPVFAVVQIGSHQFKVSNGDCIFAERLKFCDVNDKLTLNKVLLVGSQTQTIIGRPTVPDAVVHALVEEHALDAKVIIFKKKRRKNYRRTKGHRQELTKLRITDIQGIEKPEVTFEKKPRRPVGKKPEKVPVAA